MKKLIILLFIFMGNIYASENYSGLIGKIFIDNVGNMAAFQLNSTPANGLWFEILDVKDNGTSKALLSLVLMAKSQTLNVLVNVSSSSISGGWRHVDNAFIDN